MQLFQLLRILDNQITPERCKLHLAVWNGEEDPLDVYLEGRFDVWQCWQTKRNFERDMVVSLIGLPQTDHWLFAGVHNSSGCEWVEKDRLFCYSLTRKGGPNELDGRLIVSFKRPGRQSYLLGENWCDALLVSEIRPDKVHIEEFPGFTKVMLSKHRLDMVVREGVESWRSALRNVAGVYVIADRRTGKLYVGSATAEEGIWSRWCNYSATGHGGNRDLKDLLEKQGDLYAENFQFGILETADSNASRDYLLLRESRWKDLLLTREHGYNAN